MLSFFWISALSLFAFQMFILYSLGKKVRIFIYNHRVLAAGLNLAMSFGILAFMGVGNIVGLANLTGSTLLAAYIVIRGALSREKTVVRWKRIIGIPIFPRIEILNN